MSTSRAYEYHHVIGFEETNALGNVYFSHFISWQGRCREMFLREKCPGLMEELAGGLLLVTTHCMCEFLLELSVFQEVLLKMRVADLTQHRLAMDFEYFTDIEGQQQLVAKGVHGVACMKRNGQTMTPVPLPPSLRLALEAYVVE